MTEFVFCCGGNHMPIEQRFVSAEERWSKARAKKKIIITNVDHTQTQTRIHLHTSCTQSVMLRFFWLLWHSSTAPIIRQKAKEIYDQNCTPKPLSPHVLGATFHFISFDSHSNPSLMLMFIAIHLWCCDCRAADIHCPLPIAHCKVK